MKVILTQDVEKLGHAMDVVTVADGFARNYLLPRSLAMVATKSALSNLETLKKQEDARQAKLKAGAEAIAATFAGKTLVIADANVGAGGRLYGSIGNHDISDALKAQFGAEVERRQVLLEEPIRAEGFYTVPVKLHREVTVPLRVQVGNPAEEEAAPAEETAEAVAA
jgi:large subunit ribosomal protein L9